MADCKAYNKWTNSLSLDNGSYVGAIDISFILIQIIYGLWEEN